MATVYVQTSERTPYREIEQRLFLLFQDKLAVVLGFLTLQDKHKGSLSVYKARTNNYYIFAALEAEK
jgi:hypothetical protein